MHLQHKQATVIIIFLTTEFKSNVVEAISKLKLKNSEDHFSILVV